MLPGRVLVKSLSEALRDFPEGGSSPRQRDGGYCGSEAPPSFFGSWRPSWMGDGKSLWRRDRAVERLNAIRWDINRISYVSHVRQRGPPGKAETVDPRCCQCNAREQCGWKKGGSDYGTHVYLCLDIRDSHHLCHCLHLLLGRKQEMA